ncbi:MAG: ComEC/Rec2 family competence protein, partial [Actinobacteria bacterium]|nr:ComEC/Rec2 family competence protein [Actinomycetota bacterium]
GRLRTALAGDVLHVSGTASPLRGRAAPHLRRRLVVGRLEVESAGPVGPGSPLSRIANATRRTIDRGAAGLGDPARGLFGGFVLGDDRGQDPATVERFRSAGLTHLLVVSGQNVAFVLALAAPLVSRGANGARLAWTAAVLVLFGTIVRWDPSVTRAVVMAALAVSARTLGRPVDRLRLLALAVTVILLVDPLLVGSVSFLLSVGASAGIAVLSPWFAQRMRGPRPLVEILSTTAGAQVGVAPVLIPVFGSLPLASIPANLLAVPMAGPLMMWGMVAGVPAGLAGDPVATTLHWPTRVMLGWVDGVAHWAAGLGAPPVGLTAALAAALSMACLWVHPVSRRLVVPAGATVLVIVALLAAPRPHAGSTELSGGTRLWNSGGGSVLVVDEIDGRLPGQLRDANVGRVDVVVMTRGGARAAELLVELRAVVRPRRVLVPEGSGIPASVAVATASSARVGPISIELTPDRDRLKVRVSVGSENEADAG